MMRQRVELDPVGANSSAADPYIYSGGGGSGASPGEFGSPEMQDVCTMDGIDFNCKLAAYAFKSGAADIKPEGARNHFGHWIIDDAGTNGDALVVAELNYHWRSLPIGFQSARPQKTADIDMIKNALAECISVLFPHYSLVSFTPTKKPRGSGTGTNRDDQYNGNTTVRDVGSGQEIGIWNDPTPPADVLKDLRARNANGHTPPDSPWWNYTVPNVDSIEERKPGEMRYPQLWKGQLRFVRVQIHELGGSLSLLTYKYYPQDWRLLPNTLDPGHNDNGPPLEDCVGSKIYKQLGYYPAN